MNMTAEHDTIHIRIPMKLRKRAGRKEIVLPPGSGGRLEQSGQAAMVRAVARAYLWQSLLESGEALSISDLATRFHVDHSYVARTLRLASLAPDPFADGGFNFTLRFHINLDLPHFPASCRRDPAPHNHSTQEPVTIHQLTCYRTLRGGQ